jgi:hypothetical protein
MCDAAKQLNGIHLELYLKIIYINKPPISLFSPLEVLCATKGANWTLFQVNGFFWCWVYDRE